MNKYEKELFWELCDFEAPNKEALANLLPKHATPEVLGHLYFNRMTSIAFGTLENTELLGKTNREFRNSLAQAHKQNTELTHSFRKGLLLLQNILQGHEHQYALLKGALLCNMYPEGYRTSNDIDLLVRSADITEIGNLLLAAGFRQGNINNGHFVSATREEIIRSKMTRGETVPFILPVNFPYMPYLEVDINFSLDYKSNSKDTVNQMLHRSTDISTAIGKIHTLEQSDFFIHLCQHLYKEAATMPWVRMKRDMTLYKFADIRFLLSKMSKKNIKDMFARATELALSEICACSILWTQSLFGTLPGLAVTLAKKILKEQNDLLFEVISPDERKIYTYNTKNMRTRFFAHDRTTMLKEVFNENA